MSPSSCPTCEHCVALIVDCEHLRLYVFLMRLRLEFEVVRGQMMHRPTPPSLSDALAFVLAEETRLHSLGDMHHATISYGPHSVLAAS